MSLPTKHIRHQLPVIASLGGTAFAALKQQLGGKKNASSSGAAASLPQLPSPEKRQTIPPRPAELVRDYVKHVGGDPGAYRGVLPPHLFPQWGFPLAAKTLEGIPYPMARVLNGGCRLEVHAPLPADEPLEVTATLADIDDNGKRAVLHQRVVTGTKSVPNAVVGHLYAIVPLRQGGSEPSPPPPPQSLGGPPNGHGHGNGHGNGNGNASAAAAKPRKEVLRVPDGARELGYWRIPRDAGLAFAMLTGDFNPVHWVPRYAKAFGFRSTILHGFSTMARAIEGLNRGLFAGDTSKIKLFDCKFTKPLLLPAEVGLYVDGNAVYVGDAPGGSAYLTGTFNTEIA